MPAEAQIDIRTESDSVTESKPESRVGNIARLIRDFASVSELMRMAGAGFVVASLSVFMLQGWADGNDIARFYKLLSMSGLLMAGGFGLSYLMSDQKGARMFFGLGMVSVPAISAVLGALMFSLFGTPLAAYPAFAHWITPDGPGVFLAATAALLVATPATLLGSRIMARRSAGPISLMFVGLNALLLIPARDPLLIAGLVAAIAVALAWFVPRQFARDDTLRTPGGRFAMGMLYVPLIILVVRNLSLYGLDEILSLVTSAAVYLALRQFEGQCREGSRLRGAVSLATMPVAFIAAASVADIAPNSLESLWEVGGFILTLGVYLWDRIHRPHGPLVAGLIALFTGGLVAASALAFAIFSGTAAAVILGLLTGAMLAALGFKARNLILIYLGVATALGAIATGIDDLAELFFNAGWISLAVLGFCAIVGASLLERYGAMMKLKLANWRQHQLTDTQ